MHQLFRSLVITAVVIGSASVAAAGELKLTLSNGRATLIAQDVPLRQILDEWARVGQTTIVNGDKLTGPPLTLQLVDRPEREVLDLILRSASGYIAAQRPINLAAASQFDKVMILPVSRGPVGVVSAPPSQFRQPPPQPMPMPMVEDDDNPVEQPQIMPPGVGPQNGPAQFPFQPQPAQPAPNTAPRPGILPAPPQGQPNPYGPPPGAPGSTVPPPFGRPGIPGTPGNPGGPGEQL